MIKIIIEDNKKPIVDNTINNKRKEVVEELQSLKVEPLSFEIFEKSDEEKKLLKELKRAYNEQNTNKK